MSIKKMVLLPYEKYERILTNANTTQDNLLSTECMNDPPKENKSSNELEKSPPKIDGASEETSDNIVKDGKEDQSGVILHSVKDDDVMIGNGENNNLVTITQAPPPGIPDKKVKRLKKRTLKKKIWLRYS